MAEVDRNYREAIRREIVKLTKIPDERVTIGGIPSVDAGMKMPFVVVNFTHPAHLSRTAGIVSRRDDLHLVYVMIHLRTEDYADSEPLTEDLHWGLTDFTPPDCGPIKFAGGQGFDMSDKSVKPVNFASELYGSFVTNLTARTH